jgi:putative protease
MSHAAIPQLLAPAGSLDAARAALANGADAVYLGAERFNARDEGAQLTLDELAEACRLAHERGARIYLTLNTLLKPGELGDALELLGECMERGVDAAIVQDIGFVRLVQREYPGFELHGSTQMTVHDDRGAAVLRDLGLQRVVLARENTLEDIRAIHAAVPELMLESFIHGALCISYSGQCLMSGMISERSANRGSCAQSCRKDYTLRDRETGATLDSGYLISARDLAADTYLEEIARAGVHTLKIEGRKKKPEYVATVTRTYRDLLEQMRRGERVRVTPEESRNLVQIYSRGFTGGMYGGRAGREFVTRDHPDNRGVLLGMVVGHERGDLIVEITEPVQPFDGLAFEPPVGQRGESIGFAAAVVREAEAPAGRHRQAIRSRARVPCGWLVRRTSHAALLQRARASYAALAGPPRERKVRLDIRAFGAAGAPLKLICTADGDTTEVRSDIELAPARAHALDEPRLRTQLGRLGETPFVLGTVEAQALGAGLFLPISELNALRQRAVEKLLVARDWAHDARRLERRARLDAAVSSLSTTVPEDPAYDDDRAAGPWPSLAASVFTLEDARAAARAGATEIAFDPFLRHPVPPRSRIMALATELRGDGVALRLRTPTIVRPEERASVDKWLDLDLPVLSGHLGLIATLSQSGRDVTADYAVNCFNQHTAAELFRLGARRIVLSVELTVDEMAAVTAPWCAAPFDVVIYGRPEGMTIEHCILSAAFDRVPTTCRDLCVQKHPAVELTDPAGYTFPVATDAACRNRLLHSRPIDGSEFLPRLWTAGLRGFRLLFNVRGDPVFEIVSRYRAALDALAMNTPAPADSVRSLLGHAFTRGHFVRAV